MNLMLNEVKILVHVFSDLKNLWKRVKIPMFQIMVIIAQICHFPSKMLVTSVFFPFFSPVVMFLRFVTSAEIQSRSDFFEPFTIGTSGQSVTQVISYATERCNC